MKYLLLLLLAACAVQCRCAGHVSSMRDSGAPVTDSSTVDASTPDVPTTDAPSVDASTAVVDAPPDSDLDASLVLSVIADGQKTNCDSSGAAIDSITLQVTQNGTCVSTVLRHERGGQDVEVVDLTCPASVSIGCVEQSDELIFRPLAPGAYLVAVHGFVGGTECWTGFASVGAQVGTATAQTLTLIRQPNCLVSSNL